MNTERNDKGIKSVTRFSFRSKCSVVFTFRDRQEDEDLTSSAARLALLEVLLRYRTEHRNAA